MQKKQDTKKTTKTMKVRDLKPKKDAKGGFPPGPCGHSPNVQTGHGTTLPAVQRPGGNK